MNKYFYLTLLILLMLLGNIYYNTLYSMYTKHYNIPFGKIDVDRYMHMYYSNEYDVIHYAFIKTIKLLDYFTGLPPAQLMNKYILSLTWIFTPTIIFYIIYNIEYNNKDRLKISALGSIFSILGTFLLTYGNVTCVYSQYNSYIYFLLTLLSYFMYKREKETFFLIVGVLTFILSAIYHPYILLVWGIIFLYIFQKNIKLPRDYLYFIIAVILFLIPHVTGMNVINYTILSGNFGEPDLINLIQYWTNPLLLFMAYLGLKNSRVDQNLIWILFIVGILSDIGRAYLYVIPFLCYLASKWFIEHEDTKLLVFVLLVMFTYYLLTWYGVVDSMVYEMVAPASESQQKYRPPCRHQR